MIESALHSLGQQFRSVNASVSLVVSRCYPAAAEWVTMEGVFVEDALEGEVE